MEDILVYLEKLTENQQKDVDIIDVSIYNDCEFIQDEP